MKERIFKGLAVTSAITLLAAFVGCRSGAFRRLEQAPGVPLETAVESGVKMLPSTKSGFGIKVEPLEIGRPGTKKLELLSGSKSSDEAR